jgi:hypothetical protein
MMIEDECKGVTAGSLWQIYEAYQQSTSRNSKEDKSYVSTTQNLFFIYTKVRHRTSFCDASSSSHCMSHRGNKLYIRTEVAMTIDTIIYKEPNTCDIVLGCQATARDDMRDQATF